MARAPHAAYRQRLFLVSRPYLCERCHLVFAAPCSLAACGLGVAVGALFCTASLASLALEAPARLRAALQSGGWAQVTWLGVDLLGAVGVVCMGAWIVYVSGATAVLTLRSRRSGRKAGS